MKVRWIATVGGVVLAMGLAVGLVVGDASAFSETGAMAAAAGRSHLPASAPGVRGSIQGVPPLYTVVSSGSLAAPAKAQTFGDVDCPTGTHVFGGGVYFADKLLRANINSSYPRVVGTQGATQWVGIVDNGNARAAEFDVFAICAQLTSKSNWSIEQRSMILPPGQQTHLSVPCPAGTKVLGGGGFVGRLGVSNGLLVNISASYPLKSGSGATAVYSWELSMNNRRQSRDETAEALAVCDKATGYGLHHGPLRVAPANAQTGTSIACPSPTVPLGGGVTSTSTSTLVNLNSTYVASSTSWQVFENNASASDSTLQAWAVCADT
jgi:hypothetical protein